MAKSKLSGKERFDQIIDRYKAAFKKCNADKPIPPIEYKDGFVHLEYGVFPSKHRISEFERMCETLESRDVEKKEEDKVESELSNAVLAIKAIHQLPQVQYDLEQQLRELHTAANKLGLYDAADFLKKYL